MNRLPTDRWARHTPSVRLLCSAASARLADGDARLSEREDFWQIASSFFQFLATQMQSIAWL
jgi:hypothetical protein